MEISTKYNLKEKDYLDLYKWFTEDAAKIKERMWAMATFFYTFLGGLLGYTGKELLSDEMSLKNPLVVVLIGIIGCVLSGYGMYMIRSYGFHIRSGWNRANYIRFQIKGLNEIWDYGIPKNKNINWFLKIKSLFIKQKDFKDKNEDDLDNEVDYGLTPEAKKMVNLMKLIFLLYIGLIFWGIWQLNASLS
ncbi:hypothetical protein [uncultured Eudoraea sp.]|uniref:RipA family octameric membrane protein n=1 Tax=uncultured Eudoraea sp. TaxID=1035614 RepID=UPI0026303776|nr:hypothetical protein [uncultured Eudoraea sp.]